MPRFVFKLEPLLRHRSDTEKQKQLHCAELQRRLDELEHGAKLLHEQIAQANAQVRELLTGQLNVNSLQLHQQAKSVLASKLRELRASIDSSQVELKAAREGLIQATKDRKILEKLRERKLEQWQESLSKRAAD